MLPWGPGGFENFKNEKYISADGHGEIVVRKLKDGTYIIIDDKTNMGTYNYYSPDEDKNGHFFKDVWPYFIWGIN